jgi:CHASE2 domain
VSSGDGSGQGDVKVDEVGHHEAGTAGGSNGSGASGETHPADAAPPNAQAPKLRLRTWFQYIAYIAIAVLSVLIDPFNWTQTTAVVSQDLLYRMLIGPFYSIEQRDRTTVVLFGEKTLGDLRKAKPKEEIHWPVSLKMHADLLKNILLNHPGAVMVDFIFPDLRPDEKGVEALRTVNQEYEKEGVPLIFARAEGAGLRWIRNDLINDLTFTSITRPDEPGVTHGISRSYEPCKRILVRDAADPRFGRRVCACTTKDHDFEPCRLIPDGQPSRSQVAFTAAFQLFDAVTGRPPKSFDPDNPVDLQVVWSNRLNEWNDDHMKWIVDGREARLCKDVATDPWNWLRAVFDTDRFKQGCPYTNTLFAESVLLTPYDPDNLKYLQDKVVFYGGDLAGLADKVVPPTHIKLPGVYLHAMAFDNLVTFRGKYRYSLEDAIGSGWKLLFDLLVAAILASAVVLFARSRWARAREGQQNSCASTGREERVRGPKMVGVWWRFGALATLAILGLCALVYSTSRLAPLDWLGFLGIFGFVSIAAEKRWIERFATYTKERALPCLAKLIFMEDRT